MSVSTPGSALQPQDSSKAYGLLGGRRLPGWVKDPSLRRIAVTGFVATLAIFLTSCTRGFPFPKITAEPWFFTFYTPNPFIRYSFLAIFIAGVASLCWSWVQIVRKASAGLVSLKSIWLIWLAWALPLAIGLPLFSGDVYVYYVDGEAYLRGFNIYESGVSAMGPDNLVHMVHPLWQDTKTMYGPVFMRLATAIAWIADAKVLVGVAIFKVLVFAAVAAIGVAAHRIATFLGKNPVKAVALSMLNPLVLLHFVGGTHNDGLMVGLMALGLAFGVTFRPWPLKVVGLVLCALAATIKLPAFAGVIMIGWIWANQRGDVSWKSRFAGATLTSIFGLLVVQLLTMATGLGWGWLHALDVPGLAHPLFAPANALAYALGGVFGVEKGVNEVTRAIFNVGMVTLCVYFVLRLGKSATTEQSLRALGWALLALGWMGPSVYAWYLTWGVVVVATVGARQMEKMLMIVSVVACFTIFPSSGGVLDSGPRWLTIALAYLVVLAFAIGLAKTLSINGITLRSMGLGIGRALRYLIGKATGNRQNRDSGNGMSSSNVGDKVHPTGLSEKIVTTR